MTLCRTIHDKENPYTVINKTIASDDRISWKAKGIWLYAFSRPDDWTFYFGDIVNRSKDGRESVRAGLKELEEAGYLYRTYKKNSETGKMGGQEYVFFETAKTEEEIQKMFPKDGKHVTRESRNAGNQPLLNKEETLSNEENNNSEPESPPPKPPNSPDPSASRVVVFSELEDLDIPQSEKIRLSKEYEADPQRLSTAIKVVQQSEHTDNPLALLKAALKREWKPRSSEKEVVDRNKDWVHRNLSDKDNSTIGGWHLVICNKHIELTYGTHSKIFTYDDRNFRHAAVSFLNKITNNKTETID